VLYSSRRLSAKTKPTTASPTGSCLPERPLVRPPALDGHPVINKAGVASRILGSVMDVTERRHAEHRLVLQHRVTRFGGAATVEAALPKIRRVM